MILILKTKPNKMKSIFKNSLFQPQFTQFNSIIKKLKTAFLITAMIIIANSSVFSQRIGFTDDFENGTLEFSFRNSQGNRPPFVVWGTETKGAYGLSEADGVLKIDYSRLEGHGAFDHFTFHPFRAISVSENPRIQLEIKSDIAIELTASPTYSVEPPTVEYLDKEIPGDNMWHTYTFELTKGYWLKNNSVQSVDFYVDRGLAVKKTGKLEMDNFKMAWYLIKINDIQATLVDGKNIQLSWKTTDKTNCSKYKVYRGSRPGFPADETSLIAEPDTTMFYDKNLNPYKHYFYKVVPVGRSGEVFFASGEVSAETFIPGVKPSVSISAVNSGTVKKYEKFEIFLDLKNVGFENPYNPADIDIYANFTSPSGKQIKINGFYDNFGKTDKWKIRFSPNETGDYKYRIFVKDAGGTGESAISGFTAVNSEHHGWIKPSVKNPHYFQHDDGTSFYAVGVYSPWGNSPQRFETLAKYDANFMAIWDISYGGFVNSSGIIEEEPGRYNQEKLGRIDSMLSILEKDDIKLMFAIWPHDLFSETVWSAQWRQNPYNQLIDAEDVYSDSLVWEYQKQKYRYLIARFAHSRSWGIWELINEMNGTDGWAKGRHQQCYDWVEKCDKYFDENDPYNHPTTASFSGGFTEYRKPLYERNDIPNIHMYPAQGWEMKYPADTMRSGVYNYAWASQRFWNDFEKPAIFGESGANLEYYQPRDKNYHIHYHNTLWVTLTNGLAGIPVWWDFPMLNEQDWLQLKHISVFTSEIDFANLQWNPAEAQAKGADIFVMATENKAFGWIRSYEKENVSGTVAGVKGLENISYKITWINTWNGEIVKSEKADSKNGELVLTVPKLDDVKPDVAFKISKN
jgi:hypothetical protein